MVEQVHQRLKLLEYGAPVDLASKISAAGRIDRAKSRLLIQSAGERIARNLGLKASPLVSDGSGIRAVDVAGIIRLAPMLELEIAPKFLGLDDDDPRWREDFYFLANVSKHGRLLSSEQLRVGSGTARSLAELIAKSLVDMYWHNRRKPLRSYRHSHETSFYVDGEIDPYDLLFPTSEGFLQEVVRYDRRNAFNASILAAAQELLREVSDPSSVNGLVRLIEDLPRQKAPQPHRAQKLPRRSKEWKPVVDLANDVLKGLGLSLRSGFASAPGYVVNTWRVWEDLLVIALRLAYGRSAVASQQGHPLGTRTRLPTNLETKLSVYPDFVISKGQEHPRFIVDAKYKTNSEKGRVRISEADVYESLAFARATGCNLVVLAYPALPIATKRQLGIATLFENVIVDSISILGVEVETRGISQQAGLRRFSSQLKTSLNELLAPGGSTVSAP